MPIGANMAVRASVIARLGGLRTDLGKLDGSLRTGEDHEFFLRLLHAGCRGVYEPAALVRHLVPAERLNRGYFRRWLYQNGRDVARLERAYPASVPFLFGVPRYLWRQLVADAASTARAAIRGDERATVCVGASRALVRRLPARVVVRRDGVDADRVHAGGGTMSAAPPRAPGMHVTGVERDDRHGDEVRAAGGQHRARHRADAVHGPASRHVRVRTVDARRVADVLLPAARSRVRQRPRPPRRGRRCARRRRRRQQDPQHVRRRVRGARTARRRGHARPHLLGRAALSASLRAGHPPRAAAARDAWGSGSRSAFR